MFKHLRGTVLAVLLALPTSGWAQSVQDIVLAQLTEQGFVEFEVSRTLLGRIRIVATNELYRREIVFHPVTGEILRDYIEALDGSAVQPLLLLPQVAQGSQGSNSGSGSGSGSSGDDDDDDDDEPDDDDDDDYDDDDDGY